MWRDDVLTLYMGGLGKPHVEGCCPCIWGDWVCPMWGDAVLVYGRLGKSHVEGCCPCIWGDWVSPMWRDAVLALYMGGLGKPHVEGRCPYLAYGGTG